MSSTRRPRSEELAEVRPAAAARVLAERALHALFKHLLPHRPLPRVALLADFNISRNTVKVRAGEPIDKLARQRPLAGRAVLGAAAEHVRLFRAEFAELAAQKDALAVPARQPRPVRPVWVWRLVGVGAKVQRARVAQAAEVVDLGALSKLLLRVARAEERRRSRGKLDRSSAQCTRIRGGWFSAGSPRGTYAGRKGAVILAAG